MLPYKTKKLGALGVEGLIIWVCQFSHKANHFAWAIYMACDPLVIIFFPSLLQTHKKVLSIMEQYINFGLGVNDNS